MPGLQWGGTVTVTATSGVYTPFTVGTINVDATFIRLVNDSGVTAYVDFTSTTPGSTGKQFPLIGGATLDLGATKGYYSGVSLCLGVGTTSAAVRILAVK